MTVPADQLAVLQQLLERPRRVVVVSHYNPDGDAVGSSLGFAHLLKAAGHHVRVVLPNTPSDFLDWLPGRGDILCLDRSPDASLSTIRTSDIVFCLDFNHLDRIGGLEEVVRNAKTKVLIDHHQDPEAFAQATFSDTSASSTCQMVVDIAKALGWEGYINREVATCLYTGMVTDSGSFRFRSTTPHTMRTAADLLAHGVDLDQIHNAISDTNSADRLRLLGFTLVERMTVLPEQRTVIIGLGQDDLKKYHFKQGDTEGFVNYGLSIKGMRLAAFFMEHPDLVKISLRSKGDLPVDKFLKEHFNGGGHANAAGGRSELSLEATVERFMSLLPTFLQAHPA
ncbi:MAG TPA: bifunctional oligoribonuclease/PAP phosphatase NrnA [Flavobacteriales bacterium]|nr:bifunctional oligoribonuclease/PAP phosphatase NrnA [Flavobacteriales bacterium]